MPEVIVRTGADNTALQKGLTSAKTMVANFKKDARLSQVFESDNKVKRATLGFVSNLSNITSFSGLAVAGVTALGNTFKNSLTAGLVMGVGTAFVTLGEQGVRAVEEMRASTIALREEITGLGAKDLPGTIAAMKNFEAEAAKMRGDTDIGFGGALVAAAKDFANWVATGGEHTNSFLDGLKKLNVAEEGIVAAREQAMEMLREETRIAQLRESGRKEDLDAAENAELRVKWMRELVEAQKTLGEYAAEEVAARQKAEATAIGNRRKQRDADKAAQAKAKETAESAIRGRRIEAAVDREMMTPTERSNARREHHRREAALRRVINRDIEREDAKKHRTDRRGLSKQERDDIIRRHRADEKNAKSPEAKLLEEIRNGIKAFGEKIGGAP